MTGRIKPSVPIFGSAVLIGAAMAAGLIDQAAAGPPGPPEAVPVEVLNTEANAVPVSITVQEPIQLGDVEQCLTNGLGCVFDAYFTVPSGKRLVIEYVSMIIDSVDPADIIAPRITTTVGGIQVTHELGSEPVNDFETPTVSIY